MLSYRGAPASDGVFDRHPPVDRKKGEEETIRWIKASRTVQQVLRITIDSKSSRPVPEIRLPKHVMEIFRVENGELIILGNGSLSLMNAGIVIMDAEALESCVPRSKPAAKMPVPV